MVELTGSDTLIEALKKENVNVVFGIPGGAIMPVYDAIYESGIKHILVRHEQSAAHMADGFARAGKEPGVCMATSGPGATNLVTGIGTAFADSSPVIAITGQVPQEMIGKDAFQETDTIGILTPGINFPCLSLLSSNIHSISFEIPKKFNAVVALAGDP